jgi:hypothetical protein
MLAASSLIVVPVVTIGVIVTADSPVPRVTVWSVVVAIGGPKYSIPASVSMPHASPIFPWVEYSDSMSISALSAIVLRYPSAQLVVSDETPLVQNTGTISTFERTGPPQ